MLVELLRRHAEGRMLDVAYVALESRTWTRKSELVLGTGAWGTSNKSKLNMCRYKGYL